MRCGRLQRAVLLIALLVVGRGLQAEPSTVRDWNEERISFWLAIYTQYEATQTVLHDSTYPHIIYEVLNFSTDRRAPNSVYNRSRLIKETRKRYQVILEKLGSGRFSLQSLTSEEMRVFNVFKNIQEPFKYKNALTRIRAQDGMKDLFVAGLQRSGRYSEGILQILKHFDLPTQLIALVMVESLFYPKAFSSAKAGGLWQLMPGTAKPYLYMDEAVDERFDPYIATMGAARFIKQMFKQLDGSWPLIITAYNHGPGSILKAKKQLGTKNLEELIRSYKVSSFGFAGKNYYAQYLASVEIFFNPEKFYGKLTRDPAQGFDLVYIPRSVLFDTLVKSAKINPEVVGELNPSLTRKVLRSQLAIPPGYPLRVPAGDGFKTATVLKNLPAAVSSLKSVYYNPTRLPIPGVQNQGIKAAF